jgi:uncharacterized damage-inducible protein DinB
MTEQESLRYPVGRFIPPVESSASIREEQIDSVRLLPGHLQAAVSGLNAEQLNTSYREGGWTVRQVVHHLADSHANSLIRFKLALTEDWPTIKPYDEAAWARLADASLPVEISLTFITALHGRWVSLLDSMTEQEFDRGFIHPVNGRQSLARALALYEWHGRHHTAHITRLRARKNW